MNVKGFSYRMALSLLLAAGMAASCTMYYVEEPVTNQRGAKEGADGLSLALSVTSNNMPRTKMQDDVTQSANTGSGAPTAFRGLQDVHILPFRHAGSGGKESPVQGADRVNSGEVELPYTGISSTFTNTDWTAAKANGGLVANNFGHLYEHVSVPSGTASVTVYAKATEVAEPTGADALRTHRKTYGALTDKFSTAIESAGDVTFQPVPIMETAALTEFRANAQAVADFLTTIAKSSVSLTGWYGTRYLRTQRTDTWAWNGNEINGTFRYITNAGEPIAFSSSTVNTLLTTVYNSLYNYSNNTSQEYYTSNNARTSSTYKYLEELAEEIRGNIYNTGYVSRTGSGGNMSIALKAPYADLSASSHGVPDGAIAIQWNNSSQKFELVTESSGTRLVPVEDYCYPPSLWYHTNSTLSVLMQEKKVESYYTQANDWDAILAKYSDGKVVYSAATAAAIDLPLQYGPALFTFSFTSATDSSLPDRNGTAVPINNGSFPVTGIIIGEQREQSFQFHPLQGKNHYLWDNYVFTGGSTGTPKAYIKNGTQQPVSTLVLETEKGEDVHYAVEFLNNSGRTFVGATGNILPDTKFYLIGILSLEGLTNPGIDSIFKQDCQTRATFKVTTLANAYNTVPDLQNPQLEIGVQVHMDWILDTPSELPLF